MANRYLVLPAGATAAATWDAYNTAIWSDVSGGATGFSVPTSVDNVYLDAASGTGTLTVSNNGANGVTGQVCHDLICTGYMGQLTISNITLTISGSLLFVAGMTLTSLGIKLIFVSNNAETITSGTKSLGTLGSQGTIIFDGVGGSWQLLDSAMWSQVATATLTNGTFDTNGQIVYLRSFISSNSNVRTVLLGASMFYVNNIDFTISTNLTFNAGTSTITVDSSSSDKILNGGGLSYYNLYINKLYCNWKITGNNIFNDVTIVNDGVTLYSYYVSFSGDTIANTFTVAGFSAIFRILIQSDIPGTARTFTAAVVALTNCDFMDINCAGAAAPFGGVSIGDCLGNTSLNPTVAVTRYQRQTGSWESTATW